ncbi:hypothetical protein NUW58_g9916 [Xylaria curta]|uniref:Uncharacterized protein n=1 Tax=Xylaria curta TaxID=42375 RepID=A0ACC1MTN1_9PEZI|nr:hypothetical protein NUW58_g9916 [Xylaria curta]
MHVACRYNRYGVLVQLLTHDASINVTDSIGRTPLHIACRFASISVVSALVHHGAGVGLVDSQGNTPLHELLNRPYPESVSTLREFRDVLVCNGADPHVVTPALSPSHQSKRHHREEIRQLFSVEPTDGLYNWPQRPAFGEMT